MASGNVPHSPSRLASATRALARLGIAVMLSSLALLGGCASDGGRCPANLSNPAPSPAAMRALPPEQIPLGEHLSWGGILIDSRHLPDATELEISARALDAACRVRANAPAQGRFRVRFPGYFETAGLMPGWPLRVAGRLAAMEPDPRSGERVPIVTEASLYDIPRTGAPGIFEPGYRPRISIGLGLGSGGWSGGGIGISF